MSSSPPHRSNDALSLYARRIIERNHRQLEEEYGIRIPPHVPHIPAPQDVPAPEVVQEIDPDFGRPPPISIEDPKVGIIGAGIGGLYAAYLLQGLGIQYEILEAGPRLGGRLYTHKMGERPNDYYVSGGLSFQGKWS